MNPGLGPGRMEKPATRGVPAMPTEDEDRIRSLIERWAAAVHAGDMDGVLADHADDIVMFDVPPPHDGVRGIDAYRDTWPGFFEWQERAVGPLDLRDARLDAEALADRPLEVLLGLLEGGAERAAVLERMRHVA